MFTSDAKDDSYEDSENDEDKDGAGSKSQGKARKRQVIAGNAAACTAEEQAVLHPSHLPLRPSRRLRRAGPAAAMAVTSSRGFPQIRRA